MTMTKLKDNKRCVKSKRNHKSIIVENICHTASLMPHCDILHTDVTPYTKVLSTLASIVASVDRA